MVNIAPQSVMMRYLNQELESNHYYQYLPESNLDHLIVHSDLKLQQDLPRLYFELRLVMFGMFLAGYTVVYPTI